jgi:hypothetical protein
MNIQENDLAMNDVTIRESEKVMMCHTPINVNIESLSTLENDEQTTPQQMILLDEKEECEEAGFEVNLAIGITASTKLNEGNNKS